MRAIVRRRASALGRNPMRAMLTAPGIIIGVGAVSPHGNRRGSSSAIQKSISTGANVLNRAPVPLQRGRDLRWAAAPPLRLDGGHFTECLGRDVAPLVHTGTQWSSANATFRFYITGPPLLFERELTIAEGDAFTDRDVLTVNRVCLLARP
jgi:hypothetical protein